ncbi:MAG: VPLPA-CTERM sorting domain-containing protein [Gammaproteobacteria bacterium]|nr:VPLPA-CTERM sorting domain-containing protein [Gammaproteobacteria bacterium]
MKKTLLTTSVAAVLLASVPAANAAVTTFGFDGFFTMLDSGGAALANTSNTEKGANQFQTAISGTLSFDDVTGAGTGTLVPFDFFSGTSPAEAVGIKMQAIGDGMGGPGTLVLGNMLFNWSGNNGIPVSIVLDAGGFFAASGAPGAVAAAPASDGTYTNATFGYLGLGPIPIATTEWNTTNINGCALNSCLNNGSSGGLPLVVDTAANANEFAQGDGVGVGGSPFQDGPFVGFNANFDVTVLTFQSQDANATIAANCTFELGNTCPTTTTPPVPVPAAVWLFGSGLLGLVGVARRKKAAV